MIDDLNRLIDAYDQGAYVRDDLLYRILALSSHYPINDIIIALPGPWKKEFLLWARDAFDNETPLHEFVIITQGTPDASDLQPIIRIREWFRTHDHPSAS